LKYLKSRKRKFTQETIDRFDLRVSSDTSKYSRRIWFPYYNTDNEILTLRGRSIDPDIPKQFKVLTMKGTYNKGCLFGLPQLFEKFGHVIGCILVEGEADAMYLQQNGVPALGLGNTAIAPPQRVQLVKYFDFCYLALDGDMYTTSEKLKVLNRVIKKIRKFLPVSELRLPRDIDPNDMTPKEVGKYFKKAVKHIL